MTVGTLRYEIEGYVFKYDGGAYIDIFSGDEDAPFHTLNVWDYSANQSTIDGIASFIAECEEWWSDDEDAYLDLDDESHPDEDELSGDLIPDYDFVIFS
jgi:uncharacterized protein YneR